MRSGSGGSSGGGSEKGTKSNLGHEVLEGPETGTANGPEKGPETDRETGPERKAKEQSERTSKDSKSDKEHTAQIEYLIHQSTMGVHFLFDKDEVTRVMRTPTDEKEFFTLKNMERVQNILTSFLEKPSLQLKESYLENLSRTERDLMIRAYFHLVENTILANFDLKH